MALTELIFDNKTEGFIKKSNCIPVEAKPIGKPMELQVKSTRHDIEAMITIYCPRNADAYCLGLKNDERAIVQYYRILAEPKKKYPSGEDHHITSMHH